jgi:hypothetical protein
VPQQHLKFKPGVSREATSLTQETGWFECDKIRFRSGMPEKIGGWSKDSGLTASTLKPPTGAAYWGVARSLFNWVTLSGYNLLAVGTSLKYYIQNSTDGSLYDVTPIRATTAAGDVTFAAVNGSSVITVTDTAHGAQTGDFVTFSGAVSLGGNVTAAILNAEHRVTYLTANTYSITVSVVATGADSGNGGASVVGAYQIGAGSSTFTTGVGWGAGGWGGVNPSGNTGWGVGTSAGVGIDIQLRLWSQDNYGENLIFNPRGGPLYLWDTNANPNIFDRGLQLVPSTTVGGVALDAEVPTVCNYVLVSDNSRFVIAFGVDDYGTSAQDPMLIRWSDQENFGTWLPAITNQAGSLRLDIGSEIITAQQTRQEVLVWTNAALYSLQYLGPPFVWGSQIMGSNISIMGPNAVATANNVTYWMGRDKFYVYNGQVQTLPCALRQYVFGDINLAQSFQFFAGTNEAYNEIWWFYCSSGSTTIDRYVIFNYVDQVWYYGTMARTAWLDTPLRTYPVAAGYAPSSTTNGVLFYHEAAVDDGSTNPPNPIHAYIQSADFDLGDGDRMMFVWQMVPDVTFDGSSSTLPQLTMSLRPRINPGASYRVAPAPAVISANNYSVQQNYLVQRFTELVYTRVRGRQVALKIESNALGTQWQLGVPRINFRPDGRR